MESWGSTKDARRSSIGQELPRDLDDGSSQLRDAPGSGPRAAPYRQPFGRLDQRAPQRMRVCHRASARARADAHQPGPWFPGPWRDRAPLSAGRRAGADASSRPWGRAPGSGSAPPMTGSPGRVRQPACGTRCRSGCTRATGCGCGGYRWRTSARRRARCDAILVQDLGLGGRGFVMSNEAFASQYIDHHIARHVRCGPVVMSRQNLAQGAAHPWVAHGCLEGAVACATDAMQLLGPSYRDTGRIEAMCDLPDERLQHEVACPMIQAPVVVLEPGAEASWTFFGLFEPDHPEASSDADLERIDLADEALGDFRARVGCTFRAGTRAAAGRGADRRTAAGRSRRRRAVSRPGAGGTGGRPPGLVLRGRWRAQPPRRACATRKGRWRGVMAPSCAPARA